MVVTRTGLWVGVLALALGACSGFGASEEPQSPDETTGTNDAGTGTDAGDSGIEGKGLLGFSISVDAAVPTIVQGGTAKLVVTVQRSAEAAASGLDITVKIATVPEFAASAISIPAGATSGEIVLNAAADAPQGERTISLEADMAGRGTAKSTAKVIVRGKPGALDTSFGTAGWASMDGIDKFDVRRLMVGTDDKLTVLSSYKNSEATLMRFTPDGAPDLTFSPDGKANYAGAQGSDSAAMQPDGTIVIAGRSGDSTFLGITRILPDGAQDPDFGTQGAVKLPVPSGDIYWPLTSVAIGLDGSIVVGFTWRHTLGDFSRWAIRHMTSTGALVSATNGLADGTWDTGASFFLADVGIRPSTGAIFGIGIKEDDTLIGIFQISSQHSPDSSFGSPGTPGLGAFTSGSDAYGYPTMVTMPDGSVVVAAHSSTKSKWLGTRFRADGNGIEGAKGFIQGDGQRALLAVDGSGRILSVSLRSSGSEWEISRFSSTGALDASFGDAGRAVLLKPSSSPIGIGVQKDGRIVVAGVDYSSPDGLKRVIVSRLWN